MQFLHSLNLEAYEVQYCTWEFLLQFVTKLSSCLPTGTNYYKQFQLLTPTIRFSSAHIVFNGGYENIHFKFKTASRNITTELSE
jgi:hypothetical protein